MFKGPDCHVHPALACASIGSPIVTGGGFKPKDVLAPSLQALLCEPSLCPCGFCAVSWVDYISRRQFRNPTLRFEWDFGFNSELRV